MGSKFQYFILTPTPHYWGGGIKKKQKIKNLGKILEMMLSESLREADLDFQKNSLKVTFSIYLRPSEKKSCFQNSRNSNTNL